MSLDIQITKPIEGEKIPAYTITSGEAPDENTLSSEQIGELRKIMNLMLNKINNTIVKYILKNPDITQKEIILKRLESDQEFMELCPVMEQIPGRKEEYKVNISLLENIRKCILHLQDLEKTKKNEKEFKAVEKKGIQVENISADTYSQILNYTTKVTSKQSDTSTRTRSMGAKNNDKKKPGSFNIIEASERGRETHLSINPEYIDMLKFLFPTSMEGDAGVKIEQTAGDLSSTLLGEVDKYTGKGKGHELFDFIHAIDHDTRIKIMQKISEDHKKGIAPSVGNIYNNSNIAIQQSVASQHLALLRKNEVVTDEAEGKERRYSIHKDIGEKIKKTLVFAEKVEELQK